MKGLKKSIGFKRRRKALTDYKKRLKLVKGGMDRVVIRRTNKRVIGEIIRYDEKGDKILAYADSNLLRKYKWPSRNNRPTAYLTGLLLAKSALKKIKGEEYVLDIGLSSPVKNSIPFVFAKGCIDGGLKLKADITMDEKLYDYSDTKYTKGLREKDSERYNRQYGAYIKENIDVDSLQRLFKEVKSVILNS